MVGNEISKTPTTFSVKDRIDLYNYLLSMCQGANSLYPESNWQPHRLIVMSAIAVSLKDSVRVNQCETLAIAWIKLSDCLCCNAKSRDYHFRDSVTYIVYGWWALAQTFVNLQKHTKKPYRVHFNNYLNFIRQFETGQIIHIEFVDSKLLPGDTSKPQYGKPFDPNYNINFLRVYNQLTS